MQKFTRPWAALSLLVFPALAMAAGADPATTTTTVVTSAPAMAACPAPYVLSNDGVDIAKGERTCQKSQPPSHCPDTSDRSWNAKTGQILCLPKTEPAAPLGWTHRKFSGAVVFDSNPQPQIQCPKSTPDWQWGSAYFKQSWDRMGCKANSKPSS
jgi:hypothetical protein